VLRLETDEADRLLFANVFIEEGERAVCVILYEDAQPIAATRIEKCDLDNAAEACVEWMVEYDLTREGGDALLSAVMDEVMALEQLNSTGPDISRDWQGSRASRRIPPDLEDNAR
jgi:hypothetical protein